MATLISVCPTVAPPDYVTGRCVDLGCGVSICYAVFNVQCMAWQATREFGIWQDMLREQPK